MWMFFGDDATQKKPSREKMRPLIGVGVVGVHCDKLKSIERALDKLCEDVKFPAGEKFKWSPLREDWMHSNLIGDARQKFYCEALQLAAKHEVMSMVVASDNDTRPANDGMTAQEDVLMLSIERIEQFLVSKRDDGIFIMDRPGGNRKDEERFLIDCAEKLLVGTKYVKPGRLALNIITSMSANIRMLQLADLITSCTLARIAGSPFESVKPVFAEILPLLHRSGTRVHGYGLKIHPEHRYCNLYHWIVGETHFCRGNGGTPLPLPHKPYPECEEMWEAIPF